MAEKKQELEDSLTRIRQQQQVLAATEQRVIGQILLLEELSSAANSDVETEEVA